MWLKYQFVHQMKYSIIIKFNLLMVFHIHGTIFFSNQKTFLLKQTHLTFFEETPVIIGIIRPNKWQHIHIIGFQIMDQPGLSVDRFQHP